MRVGVWGILIFAIAEAAAGVARAGEAPLAQPSPSPIGRQLLKVLERWPPPTVKLEDSRPVWIRAIQTPGRPDLVGVIKHFSVPAPLAKVVELTERFEDYPRIWEDVVSVTVDSREGNYWVTDWVRKPPAFFLPKIKFRMLYVADKKRRGRVAYRQQLIESNTIESTDTLVVLDELSPSETRISVINFVKPSLGPFRVFLEKELWKRSLESSFKDDIAFRARLEHPEWDVGKVTSEAERALERFPFREVEYTDLIRLD